MERVLSSGLGDPRPLFFKSGSRGITWRQEFLKQ